MSDRLFITGATGNTGQALLRLLSSSGRYDPSTITCLCRPGGRGERLLSFGVRIAGGDASSAESVARVYRGEEIVVHISSYRHAEAVLAGCRGMKRLVMISSTGVFSIYREIAKDIEAAERAVERSGVPYTILRPTMLYGTAADRNISKMIRLVAKSPFVPLPGGGRSVFQPVHVDDLAAAILAAIEKPASIGKTYDIPGGSAHALREIVSIIAKRLGKRPLIVAVPQGFAESAAALGERILRRPPLRLEQVRRLREDKTYDFSEAARDLGYSPRDFREGVSQQIRSMYPAGR